MTQQVIFASSYVCNSALTKINLQATSIGPKSVGEIGKARVCEIHCVLSGVVPDSPASLTIPRRSLWIRFGVSRCESDRDDVLITGMDGEFF